MKSGRQTYPRTCIKCGVEYPARSSNSRFCGSGCRAAFWRAAQRLETEQRAHSNAVHGTRNADASDHQIDGSTIEPASSLSTPHSAVIEMLASEAERWRERYEDERTEREDYEDKLEECQHKLESVRDELANLKRQNALESAKRNQHETIGRFISPPLLEAIAPIICRIAGVSPIAPTNGLGDVPQNAESFFKWVLTLPPARRDEFLKIISEISRIPGEHHGDAINSVRMCVQSAIEKYVPP
jgi:hypothetical protein